MCAQDAHCRRHQLETKHYINFIKAWMEKVLLKTLLAMKYALGKKTLREGLFDTWESPQSIGPECITFLWLCRSQNTQRGGAIAIWNCQCKLKSPERPYSIRDECSGVACMREVNNPIIIIIASFGIALEEDRTNRWTQDHCQKCEYHLCWWLISINKRIR